MCVLEAFVELSPELVYAITTSRIRDVVLSVIKACADSPHRVPGWTGFNTVLNSQAIPTVSRIDYLPVLDASQTDVCCEDSPGQEC